VKTLTAVLILLVSVSAFSQSDSTIIFALPKMFIKQKEKGSLVLYKFENNLNKFTLTPGFLTIDTLRYNYSVELSKIKQVHISNGSAFWDAAGVTGAVGYALGFIIFGFFDFNEHPKFHINQAILGGFITALPFALIGGVIGSFTDHYDTYELRGIPGEKRYEYFRKLFRKYSRKPYL
jgi:hypothetical protein